MISSKDSFDNSDVADTNDFRIPDSGKSRKEKDKEKERKRDQDGDREREDHRLRSNAAMSGEGATSRLHSHIRKDSDRVVNEEKVSQTDNNNKVNSW